MGKYTKYIDKQEKYILDNLGKIRSVYGNRWIAISGENILDSDDDSSVLIARMVNRTKELGDLVGPFIVSQGGSITIVPSQPLLDSETPIEIGRSSD